MPDALGALAGTLPLIVVGGLAMKMTEKMLPQQQQHKHREHWPTHDKSALHKVNPSICKGHIASRRRQAVPIFGNFSNIGY